MLPDLFPVKFSDIIKMLIQFNYLTLVRNFLYNSYKIKFRFLFSIFYCVGIFFRPYY